VVGGLLVPQVASATTVSVVGGQLRVQGQAGEANRIAIVASGTTYTVSDAGAPITPGTGCGGVPVMCASVTAGFLVLAGDAGDEVEVTATAAGGIEGGSGDDEIQGGSGPEEIAGGAGFDELRGGPGPDSFDGGADRDIVSYEDHSASVQVTLEDMRTTGPSPSRTTSSPRSRMSSAGPAAI